MDCRLVTAAFFPLLLWVGLPAHWPFLFPGFRRGPWRPLPGSACRLVSARWSPRGRGLALRFGRSPPLPFVTLSGPFLVCLLPCPSSFGRSCFSWLRRAAVVRSSALVVGFWVGLPAHCRSCSPASAVGPGARCLGRRAAWCLPGGLLALAALYFRSRVLRFPPPVAAADV